MKLVSQFSDDNVKGEIYTPNDWVFIIKGETPNPGSVSYWAASPPDRRLSYSGSGLPFPNAEIAYENTPNVGKVPVVEGQFEFRIEKPNTFYVGQGQELLQSHVNFRVPGVDKTFTLKFGAAVPSRSLTSLPDRPKRNTDR